MTEEEIMDELVRLAMDWALGEEPTGAIAQVREIVEVDPVEWVTPEPMQLGSKVAFVARFLGRTLRYTYEIVALEPRQRLVMRTAEGPFPMETTYTWSSVGESATRMILQNRGEPKGSSKPSRT